MPPVDNRSHLAAAAARRSADVHERATKTLRRLDAAGVPITFAAVADAAEVSRSWLYRNHDIRAEIDRLRAKTPPANRTTAPAAERSTDASLHQRLDNLLDDNRALRGEIHQLREQIAVLLGRQRATTVIGTARAPVIGPCS